QLSRPRGNTEQRVGAAASGILIHARALATGKVIQLDRLDLPPAPLVMLDLEGMPPHHDELETVYLWGTQVYGDEGPSGPYRAALAASGPDADRAGWMQFLDNAGDVFDEHGQTPFVHWGDYEKSKIKSYIDRHGDPDGVGACVLECCFDLLKALRDSFALPVPSYGLKVIEQLAGYRRTMKEYGGDWAIGRCIRAFESKDPEERSRIMAEIARYNEEDLQAMAAVLSWAKGLAGTV
ncbi:MAG TPA: ribonuclease H-like domain-containing protein, partial [Spirochaetia bacterium]|nr:ribonuclease H-like domain-containing protein [Spirochaetia bacterium]